VVCSCVVCSFVTFSVDWVLLVGLGQLAFYFPYRYCTKPAKSDQFISKYPLHGGLHRLAQADRITCTGGLQNCIGVFVICIGILAICIGS